MSDEDPALYALDRYAKAWRRNTVLPLLLALAGSVISFVLCGGSDWFSVPLLAFELAGHLLLLLAPPITWSRARRVLRKAGPALGHRSAGTVDRGYRAPTALTTWYFVTGRFPWWSIVVFLTYLGVDFYAWTRDHDYVAFLHYLGAMIARLLIYVFWWYLCDVASERAGVLEVATTGTDSVAVTLRRLADMRVVSSVELGGDRLSLQLTIGKRTEVWHAVKPIKVRRLPGKK